MSRPQGRRSSNTLPVRTLSGVVPKQPVIANLSTSMAGAHKRSSSIPRPSLSSVVKPMHGLKIDQSMPVGMTPLKTGTSQHGSATPQMGSSRKPTTPQQSRLNMSTPGISKGYTMKETRNLNDKNCVMEMAKNVAKFFNENGFPESVSHREIQKIDKQSFVKYFNYIYSFIDCNYQLAPRFNEEELIRNLKEIGYYGTLAKSALVSIGALHSTSQIVGLLSWLSDLIRCFSKVPEPEDAESLEKGELNIMLNSYAAWCVNDSLDLTDEFTTFFMKKHEVENGRKEMLEEQLEILTEEYKTIEKKSSQIEELKAEAKRQEQRLEEISVKDAEMQQHLEELRNKEKHYIQRLEEIREKTVQEQKRISELLNAAKNCKMSAEEARRLKSAIANNKRDLAAASEQREQVAKLVEKREIQVANIAAENIKCGRELGVELLDMGMTIATGMDPTEALSNFLDAKNRNLSDTESRCIALTEKIERILAENSQFKMELKHTDLQKSGLEKKLKSAKADRDENERLYLSQLAELESLSVAPRSDPNETRLQYELETLQQKFAEKKVEMDRQEKELERTMAKYAQELKYGETEMEKIEAAHVDYFTRLGNGFHQLLEKTENGPLSEEQIKSLAFIPKPDFIG